jgi:MoxR-like ATPase
MVPTVVGAGGHVPQRDELAPLIVPSLKDVESYVERTLPGGKSETEVYDFARAKGHAVAIFGHSGTGKTSSARNYAAQRQLPFVPFECNPQTDEEVVQGTYIPTGNGTELAWRYSQLATAIQQPSVILLNESNRMSAKANALFLHLLQERELIISRHKNEVIPVHPGVLFVTDANPGYQGTTKHDQAFLDRFAITLEFEYDREVEKHFIPSTSLLDLAQQLREQAEREDRYRDTPVSTRLLINFVEHAKGLGMEFAIASFLASFAADERDALRMVVEVYSTRIAEELNLADAMDGDDEESFSFDKEDELTF